jgi:acetylornithine deacetylase/succinyl-diaminopimelate desuccinylase-like protein
MQQQISGRGRGVIEAAWSGEILETLQEYIRIPAKSPHFDAGWERGGHIERALMLARDWCSRQPVRGMTVDVIRLAGRTPVLLVEVAGTAPGNVLLYGHLDKQPEMSGWDADKGPWQPLLQDGRLYGRGGADDGYAVFAALTAVHALQVEAQPHPRCVILIETCEESGSYDLPAYFEALSERLADPDLVIALDSGCGNYDQLWLTTSLRGLAAGDLHVDVLTAGVHSGDAGGVVPSSFRIARALLDRLEDPATGHIRPEAFQAPVPDARRRQASEAAAVLGGQVSERFPFVAGTGACHPEPQELILNRTWRPALEVTGADGLPPLAAAGNVLRPQTTLRLSLRLPPTVDADTASVELKRVLERDPPHGARVRFEPGQASTGWHAPPLADWLSTSVQLASEEWFGRPAMAMGEGGTIPFMAMLGERFPRAQFLITGVLGPGANAHGPNEFLHLATAERVTGAVATVLGRGVG